VLVMANVCCYVIDVNVDVDAISAIIATQ
jgi:hypothetical protein